VRSRFQANKVTVCVGCGGWGGVVVVGWWVGGVCGGGVVVGVVTISLLYTFSNMCRPLCALGSWIPSAIIYPLDLIHKVLQRQTRGLPRAALNTTPHSHTTHHHPTHTPHTPHTHTLTPPTTTHTPSHHTPPLQGTTAAGPRASTCRPTGGCAGEAGEGSTGTTHLLIDCTINRL
jgi:hypothetical protein